MELIEIERLAKEAPKSFLFWLWPWFIYVVQKVASEEHEFVLQYRSDHAILHSRLGRNHHEGTIFDALLVAVLELAEKDKQAFLDFQNDNINSDLMIVHHILANGLAQIAASEPKKVLEYLLGDPRRLSVGDYDDCYGDTKRLISVIFPCLDQEDKLKLEEAIISFNHYKKTNSEWKIEDRFRRIKWNRQYRLRLLRAFPEDYLSFYAKRLKAEEERAFPGLSERNGGVSVGYIGPRITVNEMIKASEGELLNLFNKLPDGTQWDNPKRCWTSDFSRAGGSVQQSREFGEMAKSDPDRTARMIDSFEPGRHETYAGAGLEVLAESDFPMIELINLVVSLDKKGFASGAFRDRAASALEKLAGREKGLPGNILQLLERWLEEPGTKLAGGKRI